ncbi:hypothetical protein PCH_Pc20g13660 [Penicillium rubens Wisconsin 54-1255]|uniref:Uncharacterized protein n=1 Tax=Penicillium rubens (strain ATCC 28089 / DSM 1075 / NRRL 1951 / Wisconsin 54-1255) TaxID=500485 RepID=B6HH03_PENRW|nr:hypothetical protein PCH_Pc20g13660 [Penicillium rubens Wisconsin 54-1255]
MRQLKANVNEEVEDTTPGCLGDRPVCDKRHLYEADEGYGVALPESTNETRKGKGVQSLATGRTSGDIAKELEYDLHRTSPCLHGTRSLRRNVRDVSGLGGPAPRSPARSVSGECSSDSFGWISMRSINSGHVELRVLVHVPVQSVSLKNIMFGTIYGCCQDADIRTAKAWQLLLSGDLLMSRDGGYW